MAHVCPWWMGFLLVSPLRRLLENPQRMLAPYIKPGMRILEPGSGMGFFTLPMAQMVGQGGLVVCVDLQAKMLGNLRRRAEKAGLGQRIETRLACEESLMTEDLAGTMDLAVALHLVHELPDGAGFFRQIFEALKPGGRLLVLEPKGHVTEEDFQSSLDLALAAGLELGTRGELGRLSAVLERPATGE